MYGTPKMVWLPSSQQVNKNMIAWKLFKLRKDGSLGSLYMNSRERLLPEVWYTASDNQRNGFAKRVGFHTTKTKHAPHLSLKGRVWRRVEIKDFYFVERPKNQGGTWIIAQRMKILN